MRDISSFALSPPAELMAEVADLERGVRRAAVLRELDEAGLMTFCEACDTWHPMSGPYGIVRHWLSVHPDSVEAHRVIRLLHGR
jgi:hypothetical protein